MHASLKDKRYSHGNSSTHCAHYLESTRPPTTMDVFYKQMQTIAMRFESPSHTCEQPIPDQMTDSSTVREQKDPSSPMLDAADAGDAGLTKLPVDIAGHLSQTSVVLVENIWQLHQSADTNGANTYHISVCILLIAPQNSHSPTCILTIIHFAITRFRFQFFLHVDGD